MLRSFEVWVISLPTTAAVSVLLGTLVGLSLLGMLAAHYAVPHRVRQRHNDVAGFTIAVVGVIYAVLLAFIAVAVWENFRRADGLVQTEADLVGDLYRDTVGLDSALAPELRNYLYVYAETVVQDEWPAMADGRIEDAAGWQLLDQFHLKLATFTPTNETQQGIVANMRSLLDRLYDVRRGRFHASSAELPPILWWNLLAGAFFTITFSYLFGVPNFRMHLVMVGMLSASIGLVLALIVVLDHPFRGPNHVSVEPFGRLLRTVEQMAYPR